MQGGPEPAPVYPLLPEVQGLAEEGRPLAVGKAPEALEAAELEVGGRPLVVGQAPEALAAVEPVAYEAMDPTLSQVGCPPHSQPP